MRLVRYLDQNGRFDYARYRKAQVEANYAKLSNNWVYKPALIWLATYIRERVGRPKFGLCHGTRRGNEQLWFGQEFGPGTDIIGTEISDTATQFPNTIQHDFHERKVDWIGKADFVYSNSWDHAYDPHKAFTVWIETLRPGGILILEHTLGHMPEYASETDPFGADRTELQDYVEENGVGIYKLETVISEFPFSVPEYMGFLNFFILVSSL